MSDQVKMIVEPDGNVRVTVTGNASPAVTLTVSAVVDWRTFCRETLPILPIIHGPASRRDHRSVAAPGGVTGSNPRAVVHGTILTFAEFGSGSVRAL